MYANEAITFFEDAMEKNSSGELGLAETDVVFDDLAWTLLKKVSPGYAVFDELNRIELYPMMPVRKKITESQGGTYRKYVVKCHVKTKE